VKQKRFTVEQIVGVLKQAEAGVPLAELLRRVGVSEQTFYRWKKQYVGLEVDQVRQLKQLQEENTRLNARYATHYIYPSCRRFMLWFPSTIGVFRQGGRWGLICGTPVTEAEFMDQSNAANLDRLLRRLSRIKMLLGIEQLSFAGILPTVLRRNKSKSVANLDCDRTSEVVRRAVHEVRRQHFAGRKHTVVLLGGAGRIGQAVHERLKADGIEVAIIDSAISTTAAFNRLNAVSMILVDVSRHGVIQRHIHELPKDTVVLNEVFPEPNRDAVREMKSRNIAAYHIAGVKAEVYPSLPHGYKNAVPCCAIHSD
jgi:putative transposase